MHLQLPLLAMTFLAGLVIQRADVLCPHFLGRNWGKATSVSIGSFQALIKTRIMVFVLKNALLCHCSNP
jgi:hypothetical protein